MNGLIVGLTNRYAGTFITKGVVDDPENGAQVLASLRINVTKGQSLDSYSEMGPGWLGNTQEIVSHMIHG